MVRNVLETLSPEKPQSKIQAIKMMGAIPRVVPTQLSQGKVKKPQPRNQAIELLSTQPNQGKVRNEHQLIETKVSSVSKVQSIMASNKDLRVNNEQRIWGGFSQVGPINNNNNANKKNNNEITCLE